MSEETSSEETQQPAASDDLELRIQEEVNKQVAGLKANNQALKEEKKKFQERAKIIEDLGGEENIHQLMEMRARLQEDEDTKLFLSGQREKYNERITSRVREDAEARVRALEERLQEASRVAEESQSRFNQQQLSFAINEATMEAGVNPRLKKAVEGQVRDQIFFDPESNRVYVRDPDDPSAVRYGKEGRPMTPTELIEIMKDDQPELFLKSTGSSAVGASGGPGSAIPRNQIRGMSMNDYIAARKSGRI